MTYEKAAYFKTLLSLGHSDELFAFIDSELEAQSVLDDLILELAFAGKSTNKLLSILNEYIMNAERNIDYDSEVFESIIEFLRKKRKAGMLTKDTITLMQHAAKAHPDLWGNRAKGWFAMYFFADYIEFQTEQSANEMLDAFLENGVLPQHGFVPLKQGPIKRVITIIKRFFNKTMPPS